MMKKGQIGIFIVVGVALLLIASFFIFSAKSISQQKGTENIKSISEIATSTESLKNYIESCMENTLRRGLFLLGIQGGYIEGSKGGPYGELSNYLQITENDETYKVRFGIKKSSFDSLNPTMYPTTLSPFGPQAPAPGQPTIFSSGQINFDQLVSDTHSSFELHLRSYVDNNFESCMDITDFENAQGYTITRGEKNTNVVIAPEETTFTLTYPMHITNQRTKEDFSLYTFKVSIPLRLGLMHETLRTLLINDANDITFIFPEGEIADGMAVTVDRNTYNPIDLITLTDSKIMLKGEPFSLKTARINRAPALRHFSDVIYTPLADPSTPFLFEPSSLSYEGKPQEFAAIDPDEDVVSINYQLKDADGNLESLSPSGIALNRETKRLVITVTDNYLSDSQTITISPSP